MSGKEVELIHHSFPLSSSFPEGDTFSVREALLRRHGVGGSQAETSTRRIEELAASEGLMPYQVLDNRVGNTDLAHEFLAHASAQGKNREAWDAIFTAYFGRAEPVFSRPGTTTTPAPTPATHRPADRTAAPSPSASDPGPTACGARGVHDQVARRGPPFERLLNCVKGI
jgi:hypothetical protein